MKIRKPFIKALAVFLTFLLLAPQALVAQSESKEKPFKQEELDQLLAPIALYPDSLVAQILMASTYPLEVVQAERWAKQNESLSGDALTAALEKENWDPSVKSLVNFPQVLQMMNEKVDWTQKLGDAFLAQQKDVMDTIQNLRKKAQAEGNLKTNQEQKVIVEKKTQTIIIEPSNPQVVYVPTYNPTVVYGTWWYPAYPPYYYYPPGYVAGATLFSFGVGIAIGAAWGYAWGGCNWGRGDVNINVNRNTNINTKIDRSKYANKVSTGEGGKGSWKHNPEHRKGVSYRDPSTAQKFDRGASREAQSREAFRGRAEAGRQDIAKGGADQFRNRSAGSRKDYQSLRDTGSHARGESQQRRDASGFDRAGTQQRADRSAFGSYERGSQTRASSSRGRESMSSSRGGGMSRGGGGMSRGGGRRR
ncbi:MAG: DUF3300 domain-containing protein [Desulfobacteraceae bacterium]|nr:DUF3300 domain-containing protein [Desulfobacteraceae bacterium]MDH3774666.1 DUF3300 domain-containing protein [Deltaproteobacteria bacterium]MDH3838605.1 DUF3300 domain-containing protein [Desulfobacteraceae bacterium]MDH3852346.1 DUF3300 domain-containing protein [Deltaproteobacteria bacterium]PLX54032.1 MAG: DUF3300 domain-containing protein [Desulfobacteraceae bacterium]